ncbi:MAG: threonine synthase [Bacteroidetes bacterium]|nr:threonine synthase [Bacteroidota bacterium]
MKYYSTNNKSIRVNFREAVLKGIADDQGLFLPEKIKTLPEEIIRDFRKTGLNEIACTIAGIFVNNDIPDKVLSEIIKDSLNFEIPLVKVEENVFSLELFHGPTMAFKDVGARFLARCMSYFTETSKTITILVATSGDTGSAVANGFLGIEGIDVVILYPSGKVSPLQEKQFTTLGKNITAIEVSGTFDDCQEMVKLAFADPELKKRINLSSANSINIARLIPQTFYYFFAYAQLALNSLPLIISVPSGNYGNLTAGLIAKRLGLPVEIFLAASNINRPVPDYLETGEFKPRPSIETIANAMDVGNPGNFERILEMYDHSWKAIKKEIIGFSYTDDQIRKSIKQVYKNTGYLLDPHGATGYLALKEYLYDHPGIGIFFETAHPAKFHTIIEEIIEEDLIIPEKLLEFDNRRKKTVVISNRFEDFKNYLLSQITG